MTFTVRNPSTATRRVTATVSDANGRVVGGPATRTLDLAPGTLTVPLRVEEAAGRRLAPGLDLVRLTAGAERRSVRAIVLR